MAHITLTKVKDPTRDPWLRAVSADYSVPRNAQVFSGWGHNDDRVAFWIGPDGGGFGAIDKDPEGYVKLSSAMKRGDMEFYSNHPGVDEWEFEPGQFDPAAESLEVEAGSTLF